MATTMLDDERLVELLGLLRTAQTVELKLTVPDDDIRSAAHALGMDPLEAEIRQIVFFDTPDLILSSSGVVVRARRIQGGGGDTVIKLRPLTPAQIDAGVASSPKVGVEVDAMPGGFVCSASMKGKSTAADVRSVLVGGLAASSLFSGSQRRFYREHAPDGLDIDDLAALGPMNVLKLKFRPEGIDRRMVGELWLYPDGSRVLELSTKCAPDEAFQVAAETKGYLVRHGVDVGGIQQTKTKTALEYFSRALTAAPRPGPA